MCPTPGESTLILYLVGGMGTSTVRDVVAHIQRLGQDCGVINTCYLRLLPMDVDQDVHCRMKQVN